MPLFGTRDIKPLIALAPLMPGFATEPWPLKGASVLQLMYEIKQEVMLDLLPASLHPTIPPTLILSVTHVPDSSAGAFTLAEARIGCRAAARPRAFLPKCYVSTEAAAHELRSRWGYPADVADVSLRKGYDRVAATVVHNGTTILDCALINPEPISGGDIQYLSLVNLARVNRDGNEIARIVQVDPEFVIHKADRGKPSLSVFDADAWLVPGADPWWPVSGSSSTVDIEMPHLRYVIDPDKPAMAGVERVG